MSRMAHLLPVGALIAMAVCVPGPAAAQTKLPTHVRVLTTSAGIMRWLGPQKDVILVVDQGTTLEVLDFDRDEDSFWVILPPDLHGTRKVGWIRAGWVEPHVASPASDVAPASDSLASPSQGEREGAPVPPLVTPSTSAPAAGEERVTISVGRDAAAAGAAGVAGASRSYTFEDVHFERDRFSLRSEDIDRLREAAAALKADPSLVVTIEGHTCSLGTGTYNLALGSLRANAVKHYLVSAGVPAERLLTISQGERDAAYDNSREETRRQNRRVALVPKVQR